MFWMVFIAWSAAEELLPSVDCCEETVGLVDEEYRFGL